MFKFLTSYVFWIIALLALFFIDHYSPLFIINQSQTQMTIFITKWWTQKLTLPIVFDGITMQFPNHMKMNIVHSCNGFMSFIFYFAAILSYATNWKNKLTWGLLGYIVLQLVNTLRLLLITVAVLQDRSFFYVAHNLVGRYTFVLMTIGMFFIFTHFVPANNSSQLELEEYSFK